ncbi:MAG TPA: YceI family protein, partial [Actinomycetes bacterium]
MADTATTVPGTRVVDGRPVPEAGTWTIDPSHASFEFVARHLMAKTRGRFSGVSGVAEIAELPEASTLQLEIDASTVDTRDPNRDAHLRSSDFFGVEEHPTISFASTGIRPAEGETHWQVDGD